MQDIFEEGGPSRKVKDPKSPVKSLLDNFTQRLICPKFVTQGAKPNPDPGKHLETFYINVNLPKVCDPMSRTRPRLYLILINFSYIG